MSERPGRILSYLVWLCLAATLVLVALGRTAATGPPAVAGLALLALRFAAHPRLRSFSFTVWVFAWVTASMYYPAAFGDWPGFDLGVLIVPLIQIIMFGMGTTLSLADFARVLKMPWPVVVGMVLQFTVMPLAGLAIAILFRFEPEVAAGVILIGSCSGGVASNLMAYLARGDVALSVTMTACSTLMSPLMTPFLMQQLAGRLVPIDFVAMMLSILNLIVVPVVAGLLANKILYGRARWENSAGPLAAGAAGCAGVAIAGLLAAAETLGPLAPLRDGLVIGAAMIGVVFLAKLVINVVLEGPANWMDRALPVVSMVGICVIIAIITARSREKLLAVAVALIAAAVLHNAVGYVLGYWASRAARLDERTCRTVAFEVGMQNGGMASALAMNVLGSANAALAPAIFGPWMNVSGSVLATWWHARPVPDAGSASTRSSV
jgi:BASS family bile acid:Na+ symporter